MSGTLVHPEHLAHASKWARARDVLAGEDAVKAAGSRYLPRLDSQSDKEFSDYVARGSFFNATARTLDGFLGMIFRKPAQIALAGEAGGLARNDADLAGTTLEGYARNVMSEVLAVGRSGTLIDWNDAEGRAYLAHYKAEDILDWEVRRYRGKPTLWRVLLREQGEALVGQEGPFQKRQALERLREVFLAEQPDGRPKAMVETWQKNGKE